MGIFKHGRSIVIASLVALASCQSFPIFTGTSDPLVKNDKDVGVPSKYSMRVSQFVFYSDYELPKNEPLFKDLSNLREAVYKDLQLPPSNTLVQVYLFEDRGRYETYMRTKYPSLPKRRAYFLAQPKRLGGSDDLLVYAIWTKQNPGSPSNASQQVQQDLRHELTHALLHAVLKDVPLWLDEGLAECYEMPSAFNGVNYQHLEKMRDQPKFDLARLEGLTEVEQMTQAEYRESWAWTHTMLRTTPEARQILLAYLQELRTNNRPAPLKPRLERAFPNPDDAVRRHLADLDLGKPSTSSTASK